MHFTSINYLYVHGNVNRNESPTFAAMETARRFRSVMLSTTATSIVSLDGMLASDDFVFMGGLGAIIAHRHSFFYLQPRSIVLFAKRISYNKQHRCSAADNDAKHAQSSPKKDMWKCSLHPA